MRGSWGSRFYRINRVVSVNSPRLSIVICFRDWGLDRLKAAVRSHFLNAQIGKIELEVIVSDYGSQEPSLIVDAIEPLGARVVRTETSDVWSRAAALNAGVRAARAPYIVTTDADIIFTPAAMPQLLEQLAAFPDALYLIQCRDLPESYPVERIDALLAANWEEGIAVAKQQATIRPRWGMGGFSAFSRSLFSIINGYDERMKVWGGEDNDFAQRARWAGFPIRWLSRPDAAILHMWHEPSKQKASETDEGRAAMEFNREIVSRDKTLHRNLPLSVRLGDSRPLISVIIPTYRRSALLRDAVESCLRQTFQDFELIVVENGDSREAEAIVVGLEDPRVKYFSTSKYGAAAARNFGVARAVGRYVVIHDDDDIMVPTRLEDHLSALESGCHGTYGGWIDFDDETFEVLGKYPGKKFSFEAVLCTGKVLAHGALMLDSRVFSMFRYVESLSAGIDYGFILLLARHGLRLNHTGRYAILRRIHQSNMTVVRTREQKLAASRMIDIVKSELEVNQYSKYRAFAAKEQLLECDNEADALGLLNLAQNQEAGCEEIVFHGDEFGGGGLEELRHCLPRLDHRLAHHIVQRRPMQIRLAGFSSGASIYVRMRAIYIASSMRRSIPKITDV